MTLVNDQILTLINSGLTPEQISSATGYDLETIKIAINAIVNRKPPTAEELIQKYRPEMINILYEIAINEDYNESARVRAATVIVEEGKESPSDLPLDKLSEQFQKMKRIVEEARSRVINIEDRNEKLISEGCLAT